MSITVEVTLLSGRIIALTADADESLTTLKRRAETALRAHPKLYINLKPQTLGPQTPNPKTLKPYKP